MQVGRGSLLPARTEGEAGKRVREAFITLRNDKATIAAAAALEFGRVVRLDSGDFVYDCLCYGRPGVRTGSGRCKLARVRELVLHVKEKVEFHDQLAQGA
jgi:hypothetical protein